MPEETFLYPIRWNTTPDGSGPGGNRREVRVHPDDVHLGWSSLPRGTKLDQFIYDGRLEFNPEPTPTTGEPAVPRYDIESVSLMYDSEHEGAVWPDPEDPDVLEVSPLAREIGEFCRCCPEGPQPGNLCDQEWSARADPHWSPDSTSIVYRELSHGVGAADAETGRDSRIVIARLVEREHTAQVEIVHDTTSGPTPFVSEVAVTIDEFRMDGAHVINGSERAIRLPATRAPAIEWHSDLALTGEHGGTEISYRPDGEKGGPFRARIDLFQTVLFNEGDMVSTIDGTTYAKHPIGPNHQPF